ncbi:LacI family DNA-binding transcriptional regulator [Neobacillus soli]|uniref:LacI family DNA-binding transcriptional regulator n=1 Tax=Neobacillus soli TaxID=220688 RepID=UPI00082630C0|nr:LacI family DNA-binding transcriptional regulator [Neobacillus soli]
MAITIKDIARKANVSITTVSRVINQKSEGIGDSTRKKVLDIIEELDYRPNSIARSMITKQTNTIGLIIPDIRNPFFPELVRGVEDFANQHAYNVFLCNTDGEPKRELEYISLMKEKNVDGIIFTYSCAETIHQLEEIVLDQKIPLVLLDRGVDDQKFSGVSIDNEKAGYLATKHLLDLSHTKIGCITGPAQFPNSKDRLNGYRKALKEAGIPFDQDLILAADFQMDGGYQAAKTLLAKKDITAIFAFNDVMAFGVYQAAAEQGMNIPEDVSVVGFDNINYNQLLNPKLTTIEQSVYDMGEISAKILLEQITQGGDVKNKTLYLEPSLILRESTKKLEN